MADENTGIFRGSGDSSNPSDGHPNLAERFGNDLGREPDAPYDAYRAGVQADGDLNREVDPDDYKRSSKAGTLVGALSGAVTGALIGERGGTAGAVIAGALGAAAGAAVGARIDGMLTEASDGTPWSKASFDQSSKLGAVAGTLLGALAGWGLGGNGGVLGRAVGGTYGAITGFGVGAMADAAATDSGGARQR